MDLALEGCSRISRLQGCCCGGTTHAARMRTIQSARRSLTSAKGRSFGLSYAEMATSSTGGGVALDFEQDRADRRPISRSSVKPRRTGDCMMNESWFDDPAVITGDVAFARTKWKHMSSLRAAFCCEKVRVQAACLTLEGGDWPDCAPNASIYQQARHSGRSASSAGAWRAEISCAGPDHLISGQPTAVVSGKADVWTRPVQFRQAGTHGLPLKPLNSPR
jgi:hypothetical protein